MSTLWIKNNFDHLVEIRHHLHQNPEIGFEEFETSAYLMNILEKAGYVINQTNAMKTGFTCDYGLGVGPILGIRCDLDAIKVFDAKDVPYRSRNDGIMHACGHDVHMTVVTGLALLMKDEKVHVPGMVRFIFQPAEEQAPGGALAMIDGGALNDLDHIIGLHVAPGLEAGKVGIKYGSMSANVDLINITLKGDGGHTSRPHDTVDLVAAVSQLIIALDEAILHHIDPQQPVVLSFGSISGGNAFNVIPSRISLQGTLRYLNAEVKNSLYDLIAETIHNIGQTTGAKIDWHIPYSAPGIHNDDNLTSLLVEGARKALDTHHLVFLEKASMGGEDFAYYLEKVPGAYFRVGCSDGYVKDLHSINFDVNENCIPTAIKVLEKTVSSYFGMKS